MPSPVANPRYLTQRKSKRGWYFIRAVLMPLRDAIGCSTWRRKVGNTLTEAKRNALVFLEETDQLIREAQGQQLTPEQKILSLLPVRYQIPDDLDAHDLVGMNTREPMYLDESRHCEPSL